jgi:hypothetical protein
VRYLSREEGIDIDGKIGSDLVDKPRVDRAGPGMIAAGADGVIKLEVTAQVAYDGARDSYRILPLHTHVPAVSLVQNVDPGLRERAS